MKKFDPVKIIWQDAAFDTRPVWCGVEEVNYEGMHLQACAMACGFFLKKTRHYYYLVQASQTSPDGRQVSGVMLVPTGPGTIVIPLEGKKKGRRRKA